MQYGALVFDGYGQDISRATGKYTGHRSSSGGYKTQRRKKGMTNTKKPDFLSRYVGAECGNNSKGKLGGFGRGRRQQ